jgi:hypothetical protein
MLLYQRKKQFARELTYTLKNIYDDQNTVKNKNRILDQNRFDIEAEYLKVTNDMKLLQEGNLDKDILKQYEFLAIQQGFFNKVKDKDGKEKKKQILNLLLMSIFLYWQVK